MPVLLTFLGTREGMTLFLMDSGRRKRIDICASLDEATEIVYNQYLGGSIMQKRNRFARHGSKYPKRRVITTHNPGKSEAFYHATDADAPLGPRLYAAGVI